MNKKIQKEFALTGLTESPWHWRSLAVYLATLLLVIDIVLQIYVFHDSWSIYTGVVLLVLLAPESVCRITKRKTWLGEKFTPVLSLFLIASFILFYLIPD